MSELAERAICPIAPLLPPHPAAEELREHARVRANARLRASRRYVAPLPLLPLLLLSLATGCSDFGRGGTGELVVPKERLHDIDGAEMARLPTTRQAVVPPPNIGPVTQPTTLPSPVRRLTIADVRRLALANNLDLKVDLLDPAISHTVLTEAEAKFEAMFTANIAYANANQPVSSELSASRTEDLHGDAGVTFPLLSGGTLTLDLPADRFRTNNSFSFLNPAYTASPLLTLTQPLLRGAGTDATAQSIRVAFYEDQATQARTKLEVIRVLADAERLYWQLYAAREEVDLRRKEYELAVAQLERAKRQSRIGIIADVDIVRAESGVADRVEAIIIAETTFRDRQRALKRILNEPGLEMEGPTLLVPATPPNAVMYRLDPVRVAAAALSGRMEMLQIELRIAEETANVRFARNDALPLVTINYNYGVNGLGRDFGDAFQQVRNTEFASHTIGLQLVVPIGNQAAMSRLRHAMLNRLQQLATREQQVAQIKQEVFSAIDTLESDWQRLLAARERVILAARVVNVETRQFNIGVRTSTDVLDAETKLANARSSEIAAVTDYQIAQVDIAFATGTVLGASHIVWQSGGR